MPHEDNRVWQEIQSSIDHLKHRSVRLRFGRVSGTGPLKVKLGNSTVEYTNVKQVASASALVVNDHVAVLMSGNDLLVLGKVV